PAFLTSYRIAAHVGFGSKRRWITLRTCKPESRAVSRQRLGEAVFPRQQIQRSGATSTPVGLPYRTKQRATVCERQIDEAKQCERENAGMSDLAEAKPEQADFSQHIRPVTGQYVANVVARI